MSERDVRVLVIDDSAYNRDNIADMLSRVPGITVVGQGADGNEGLREAMALSPDVITLDLEMPNMDGYTFLRILMTRRPTPVIVISSHSAQTSVFKALELGAVDFIAKPARAVAPELNTIERDLVDKILAVGRLRPVRLRSPRAATVLPVPEREPVPTQSLLGLVCIGASTGGPPALKELFEALPGDLPVAILVAQHMPASFTGPFARRLDSAGPFAVREAQAGDVLEGGHAYVSPGAGSLVVQSSAGRLSVGVEPREQTVPRPRIVPSADRLMESAVAEMGRNVMGVVLTGMGDDGSRGVRALRAAGAVTVAESEQTAVIFGMPEAAIRTGAIDEVLPLDGVAAAIIRFARALPR